MSESQTRILTIQLFPRTNKGQLISKCLCGVSNSPKNEIENSNFWPSLLEQKIFVHFMGELKKTKMSFRNQLTFNRDSLPHDLCIITLVTEGSWLN